jgi:anti-sigma regulatory factor (Ser/Thr protein kinase)
MASAKETRGPPVVQLGLPAEASAVCTARRHAGATCDAWGLPADVTAIVLLVVSEFAGNVVRHVGGVFRLVLRREASAVCVEVEDTLDCPPPRASDPGMDAETGRGLLVVERLADRFGCVPLSDGKRMWARIAVGAGR